MLELNPRTGLPDPAAIAALLTAKHGVCSLPYVDAALIKPAAALVNRPSKRLRAKLVALGAELGQTTSSPADARQIELCAQAVELLHAGSLIVDDIQDGSPVRRGAASIHAQYGTPHALCAGNWLYFWPLRLIRELALPLELEHRAFSVYHDAVEIAHYGQALDLSVRVDELSQRDVEALVMTVLETKTGAITALAMSLGAIVAGAPPALTEAIHRFGVRFGVALQQLDDLGNVVGKVDPEKRFEDLFQHKLSGVWLHAARSASPEGYLRFVAAAKALVAGDGAAFAEWLAESDFVAKAVAATRCDLAKAYDDLADATQSANINLPIATLKSLEEALVHAYL